MGLFLAFVVVSNKMFKFTDLYFRFEFHLWSQSATCSFFVIVVCRFVVSNRVMC